MEIKPDKIKNKDMKRLSGYIEELSVNPDLKYLFIELTNCCNLLCRHCGSCCNPESGNYIDTAMLIKSIEEIGKDFSGHRFMFCLTGGEPLLHPNFDKIVKTINDIGVPWGMTTNGTLISSEIAVKLRKLKMGSVSISVDGLKESHEWLRQIPGSYKRTIDGIKELKKAGHRVQVTTCVGKHNINELEDMYIQFQNLNIDSWRLTSIDPIGRACNDHQNMLDGEDMRHLLDFIKYKRFDNSISMDICYGCAHYLTIEYERMVRDHYFICGSGIKVGSILCNGDIYACLDIERRPELVQGNIQNDRFSDIWKSKFEVFRENRSLKSDRCRECKEKAFCRGDSAHTWDYDSNEPIVCMKGVLNGDT